MIRPFLSIALAIAAIPPVVAQEAPAATPAAAPPATSSSATSPSVTDMSLSDALARARASAPRLAQLGALARAAEAARESAAAQGRPQVDASVGYSRQSDVPELRIAIPGVLSRALYENIPDNFRSRAQLQAPLYTGGRTKNLVAAAEREVAATRLDSTAGTNDLALETANAYWSLVVARESESVLTEAIVAFDAHLRDAANREKFGLAAPNEVLAVQVERDRAELSRIRARNASTVAEANLARLTGLPLGAAIRTTEPLALATDAPELTRTPIDTLVADALAHRPERAALEERVRGAEARIDALRASRRPQVVAVAGYDYANPNRRIFPATDSWRGSWDVGVAASWSLFDFNRTGSAVAEASARRNALKSSLDDFDRRVRLDVTRAVLDAEAAAASVRVAETAIVSARENRRVAAERYRAGVAVSSELLDAETALLRAGLDRADALASVRVAAAALDRAVGR